MSTSEYQGEDAFFSKPEPEPLQIEKRNIFTFFLWGLW